MLTKQTIYPQKVLRQVYFLGQFSCAEIDQLTQKSIPLTIKILNELISDGHVMENYDNIIVRQAVY